MKKEELRKILRGKCISDESCEAAISELLDLFNVSISSHDMLKEILNECPYVFDYATIPKSKDMSSPQICGSISIAYQRYQKAQEIISDECREL